MLCIALHGKSGTNLTVYRFSIQLLIWCWCSPLCCFRLMPNIDTSSAVGDSVCSVQLYSVVLSPYCAVVHRPPSPHCCSPTVTTGRLHPNMDVRAWDPGKPGRLQPNMDVRAWDPGKLVRCKLCTVITDCKHTSHTLYASMLNNKN